MQALSSSAIQEYFDELAEDFEEEIFDPLDDVWEDELSKLLGDDEGE